MGDIKALVFDVFGTVVDWRGSIIREVREIARERHLRIDAPAFADAWRAGYRPAMDRVRSGELAWTNIDGLHRRILDELIPRFGLDSLDESERDRLNRVWHRLRPWPDAPGGLRRLKRRFVVATLSNGNVALLVNMAKATKLPWDCILSAELFGHYKPDAEVYLGAARLLGVSPAQTMMVAAHKDDLDAAARAGLATAFVQRPLEFGATGQKDVAPEERFEVNARNFLDLADQLGC
jgi:2-haloacid dehalogenase